MVKKFVRFMLLSMLCILIFDNKVVYAEGESELPEEVMVQENQEPEEDYSEYENSENLIEPETESEVNILENVESMESGEITESDSMSLEDEILFEEEDYTPQELPELRIVRQPVSFYGNDGEVARFSIEAEGTDISYKWEYSTNGGKSWIKASSETASAACKILQSTNGWLYRCTVTDCTGNVKISDPAEVILKGTLKILIQPVDFSGKSGEVARFSISAVGEGIKYKWEYSSNGGASWIKSSSETASAACKIQQSTDGWLYRCTISDNLGNEITSAPAMVILRAALSIYQQPVDFTGKEGDIARFTIGAEGQGLKYKWEYSTNGGKSWLKSSSEIASAACKVLRSTDGWLYRCTVSDSLENEITSSSARVIYKTALSIYQQPIDFTGTDGDIARFTIGAEGQGLKYNWEYSTNGGSSWVVSSSNTATAACRIQQSTNGWLYRCTVSDNLGNTIVSDVAEIKWIIPLRITKQPEDKSGTEGDIARFIIGAEGQGLKYKWEYSTNGGNSWVVSAASTATAACRIQRSTNGWLYRCTVSDNYGNAIVSNTAEVKWKLPLKIFSQPESKSGTDGDIAYFTVGAEGEGLKYSWEYSTNNGSSWIKSSAKSATAACRILQSTNGWLYRCTVSDSLGNAITSNIVKVNWKKSLKITKQPDDINGKEGSVAYFSISADGDELTYKWEYSTDGGNNWQVSSAKTATAACRVLQSTSGWLYRCTVSDAYGNSLVSRAAVLRMITIEITNQPQDCYQNIGKYAGFTIGAQGNNISYKWEFSDDDGNTWKISSATESQAWSNVHDYNVNGRIYRCTLSDSVSGYSVVSDYARVYVKDFAIYKQPQDAKVVSGKSGVLKVFASGVGLNYQWQKYNKSISKWEDISGANKAEFDFILSQNIIGTKYRCKVTDNEQNIDYSDEAEINIQETGFVDESGSTYYYDPDGNKYVNGFYTIDGNEYYFDASGKIAKGLKEINNVVMRFDEDTGALIKGFYKNNTSHYRYYYDGKNGKISDCEKIIDGSNYYFYSSGVMARGLTTINGKKYYFDWDTGKGVTGLVDLGMGHYMYFGNDRSAQSGIKDINGKKYYFDTIDYSSKSGFITYNNQTYYFLPETYQMVTGFAEISGAQYYFDSDGKMKVGTISINGNKYITDESGKIKTGRFSKDGVYYWADEQTGKIKTGFYETSDDKLKYYYDGENGRKTGLVSIGGNYYLFNGSGVMMYGVQTIDNEKWLFNPSTGKAESGLIQYNGNLYYTVNGKIQYGIKAVDGKIYCFNEYGSAIAGFYRDATNNDLYFFDYETHAALIGWQVIYGNRYYFGENGKAFTAGVKEINGKKYVFNDTNVMLKGKQIIDGKTYYFSQDTGEMITGLISLNGYIYYFTNDGISKGLQTINGKTYYFNENTGIAQKGYKKFSEDNIYFFDEYSRQGIDGLISWNGWTYYCNNGKAECAVLKKVDNSIYRFDSTSVAWKTALDKDENGVEFYFDETGTNLYGLITYRNQERYFYKEGGYVTSTGCDSLKAELEAAPNGLTNEIGGVKYYKENGAIIRGFKTIGNDTYYFSEVNGAMLTGLRLIEGEYYYFGEDGKMKTGKVTLERGDCWFDETGKMLRGKVGEKYYSQTGQEIDGLLLIDQKVYYGSKQNGFIQVNGNTFYLENGKALTGKQIISGKTYYFSVDGIMQKGEITVNNIREYYDIETGKQLTGFVKQGNETYYYDTTRGKLSGLQEIGGKTYYFSSYGIMRKGRVTIDAGTSDVRYFNNVSGEMMYGFIDTEYGTYYANPETGKLVSGFYTINGKNYYFNPSSNLMAKGWANINGNKYYMDSNGVQQLGFTKISGNTYYFYSDNLAKGIVEIEGDEYRFSEEGIMRTGWVQEDNKDYYYDMETGKRIIGLAKYGDRYYDFLRDGTLAKGATTLSDGREFYFDTTYGIAEFGLQSYEDGKLYYYDVDEGLYKNKTWTMDGVEYRADSEGVVSVAKLDSDFAELLNAGFQYLGTPYGSFEGGLVCSTFVAQVLNDTFMQFEYNEGKSLHMYSMFTDLYPNNISYDKSDLQIGDIVFYVTGDCGNGDDCSFVGEIHHVGFYIGNGKMMEATSLTTDATTGEKYGYTLVRDIVDNNDYFIVAIVHILDIIEN